jgi:hypothetical protein
MALLMCEDKMKRELNNFSTHKIFAIKWPLCEEATDTIENSGDPRLIMPFKGRCSFAGRNQICSVFPVE